MPRNKHKYKYDFGKKPKYKKKLKKVLKYILKIGPIIEMLFYIFCLSNSEDREVIKYKCLGSGKV